MRCTCCNRSLNDYESTLKHAEYEHYLDTCMSCLEDLGVPYVGRDDLNPFDSSGDDDEYLGDSSGYFVDYSDDEPT